MSGKANAGQEESMAGMDDIWSRKRKKLHRERKMKPLVKFTHDLREDSGESVPNFDPDDGGMEAEVLLLFQDPGPTVSDSDFISRDNYPFNKRDYSAKNVTETGDKVGLARERTISWNAVPWRVAEGDLDRQKKRATRERWLTKLLRLFDDHNLRAVALFGGPAREFSKEVREARPDLRIFETWHPGIRAMNQKGKREHFEETFRAVRGYWRVRTAQKVKQSEAGRSDAGSRGSVTGGAQMDAMADLVAEIFVEEGFPEGSIQRGTSLELPGYYRPEKKWDPCRLTSSSPSGKLQPRPPASDSEGRTTPPRIEHPVDQP